MSAVMESGAAGPAGIAGGSLTPALSPAGEREKPYSLSRSRERAGVRAGVLTAIVVITVLVPIANLLVPAGKVQTGQDFLYAVITFPADQGRTHRP